MVKLRGGPAAVTGAIMACPCHLLDFQLKLLVAVVA